MASFVTMNDWKSAIKWIQMNSEIWAKKRDTISCGFYLISKISHHHNIFISADTVIIS